MFWDSDEDQRGGLASEKAHTARAGGSLGTGGGGLGRARRQALREGKDVLGDLAFAVTDNEWNPAVDRQYQSAAVRDDRVRDLAAEARFDVRGLDAAGAVVTVRDELQLLVAVAELLRDLHEDAHVLEARDLESHQREDHVRDVEHRDHLLLEAGPRVDDDVRVALAQELENVLHVRAGDELGRLRRWRREEHLDPRGVRDEHRFEDVGVGVVEAPHEVRDGLGLWTHVEDDGDVPEGQAAVHEHDRLLRRLVQRHREVGRDRGPADAALGREERDDLAVVARGRRRRERVRRGRGGRGRRVPGALHLLELVDVADRVDQFVRREGLHQELARAGEHRAAQVILLALDAHHDDRRLRNGVADDLGRRDPIHVGHVDVHQDHVRPLFLSHVDRGLPTVGRAGHFHVRLEADQLREIVASVGDVVDDEDADLLAVGHYSPNAPLLARVVRSSRPIRQYTGKSSARQTGVVISTITPPPPAAVRRSRVRARGAFRGRAPRRTGSTSSLARPWSRPRPPRGACVALQ